MHKNQYAIVIQLHCACGTDTHVAQRLKLADLDECTYMAIVLVSRYRSTRGNGTELYVYYRL